LANLESNYASRISVRNLVPPFRSLSLPLLLPQVSLSPLTCLSLCSRWIRIFLVVDEIVEAPPYVSSVEAFYSSLIRALSVACAILIDNVFHVSEFFTPSSVFPLHGRPLEFCPLRLNLVTRISLEDLLTPFSDSHPSPEGVFPLPIHPKPGIPVFSLL